MKLGSKNFERIKLSYAVVLERSATGYAAFSPDVPGCVATGKSEEQTITEMHAALVFHFEGMADAGEPLPEPRGLEHYVRSGEYAAEPGDLLTTIPRDELLPALTETASPA